MKEYLRKADEFMGVNTTHEQLRAYQNDGLKKVIPYVKAGSPFYASHLAQVDGFDGGMDTLKKLPFTDKHHVGTQGTRLRSTTLAEGGIYYETSGTTGKPTPAPRSWFEAIASSVSMARNLHHAVNMHVRRSRPVAAVLGPSDAHSMADGFSDAMRAADVPYVRAWPLSPRIGMERTLDLIEEAQVNVLISTTATLFELVRVNGLSGRNALRNVELVLTAGENNGPSILQRLETAYRGAKCLSSAYGGAEIFVVASTCGYGAKHLAAQNYVAEVLDVETGCPLEAGSIGELVVTFLVPGIRPLIRYRTGDLVSVARSACECANRSDIVVSHGRMTDVHRIGQRLWLQTDIEEAVCQALPGLFNYQLSLERTVDGDRVNVSIEHLGGASEAWDASQASSRLSHAFGMACEIHRTNVDTGQVNRGGVVAWKPVRIVDKRHLDAISRSEISTWLSQRSGR